MGQSLRKQEYRHETIQAANPPTDLPACLGKQRFESEAQASAEASFRPYYCVWCDGYHVSRHGFKGSRKGR